MQMQSRSRSREILEVVEKGVVAIGGRPQNYRLLAWYKSHQGRYWYV